MEHIQAGVDGEVLAVRGQCESSMQWGTAASENIGDCIFSATAWEGSAEALWLSAAEIPRSPTYMSVLAGSVSRWGTCLPYKAPPSLKLLFLLIRDRTG